MTKNQFFSRTIQCVHVELFQGYEQPTISAQSGKLARIYLQEISFFTRSRPSNFMWGYWTSSTPGRTLRPRWLSVGLIRNFWLRKKFRPRLTDSGWTNIPPGWQTAHPRCIFTATPTQSRLIVVEGVVGRLNEIGSVDIQTTFLTLTQRSLLYKEATNLICYWSAGSWSRLKHNCSTSNCWHWNRWEEDQILHAKETLKTYLVAIVLFVL